VLPLKQNDVTDIEATERAVAAAAEKFGKLNIVFANAGIGRPTPVGQTSQSAFDEIIRTNLTAVFFTVQAAATHLNERASIILNGSVHAVMGVPGYSAYAATKAGVRAMTRNLASEFAPRGIRVNQVTPGAARTPIWSASAPTDEAKAVLFLASDDASNVTGAEIVVDGGATGAPQGAPIYRTE
jgi:NAD(P)-dependent dehydrogenase (short-subunit alcohol dehydrogenase family)